MARMIEDAKVEVTWGDGRKVQIGTIHIESESKDTVRIRTNVSRLRIGWSFVRLGLSIMKRGTCRMKDGV